MYQQVGIEIVGKAIRYAVRDVWISICLVNLGLDDKTTKQEHANQLRTRLIDDAVSWAFVPGPKEINKNSNLLAMACTQIEKKKNKDHDLNVSIINYGGARATQLTPDHDYKLILRIHANNLHARRRTHTSYSRRRGQFSEICSWVDRLAVVGHHAIA